ncbi:phosphoribosylformimino-5-aminoimidazole carboxamide ribotide isomerase [Phragmitibacter flavus]|uniref:Phosphoribosylformimino-5-aminoimidazole carboxamide ribotide isomerase n=1 Tax=Phragmitibacter flavus TaxID=2576071 RepID=A0A5R8KB40_9BACT|nr:phosphoribosylformimino-5-aminoimidazole carboxamide ribotide isomerase [Phragmitibacter flavus]TLD69534.1 phosphoribosylformimino-5-aminoimidazole carboxamide ribotide isomerase [Phragmitibacter flavus]
MTRFRPCIDLHDGKVKQIVGSTLQDIGAGPKENFVSDQSAAWFAHRYREDGLTGGHVIMLGGGNEEVALQALEAFPGGLQIGGGIKAVNALKYLEAGASHVIVTSAIFDADGKFNERELETIAEVVGRDRLVLDLSCKAHEGGWRVAMNRWQLLTDLKVDEAAFRRLSPYCAEFLIHAVDVEGKCEGIDEDLVVHLAGWCGLPMTYAGGARSLEDLKLVDRLSDGKIDVTIGSALDIFGGSGVKYEECVAFNRRVG